MVAVEQGTVTLYAPQVDEMTDEIVRFRSALAWRPEADADPVFGVGWFEADVAANRFAGTLHPLELRVTRTRFPADAPELTDSLAAALARPGVASGFTFSRDELQESLAGTQAEQRAAQELNTAPPKIIYRDHPALLVVLDGEPVLREIENSPLEAVINTPYPLIHDGRDYWLNVADGAWYRSRRATGPYAFASKPPADVAAAVRFEADAEAETAAPAEPITARNAPEIVVSTEPAELIVTEGPAAFVPLVDDLLVLQNSDDDVFMHVSGQHYYVVLSGRWYRSRSLNGPWTFHAAENLPPAFANIPLDSDQAGSRVYVAGTEEARDAVLDSQLPQAAVVERGTADVEVEYDGRPEFARVDGTDMVYARNTGSTVIRADGLYYLVEDGVWYVSASPYGPWDVATARPGQVRVILPSSPVYAVKYVYIYDYTPDVVYVGYTPGYLGSYVYYGTVLYGSGWYYRPWISPRYYYPRHSTWGFHVNYNPWSGWGFGLSWYWGPFSVNYYSGGYWHHHHHWYHRHYARWWGPCGYRPSYGHYAHRRPGYGGHRPVPYQRHSNLYRDDRQPARVVRTHDRTPRTRDFDRPDVRAAKMADGRDLARVGADPRFDKAKYAAPRPKPVSRTDLAAKAVERDRSYKAAKSPPAVKNRREAKAELPRAGGARPVAPNRTLKRETLNDLGKLRGGKEPALPTGADTRRKATPPVRTTAPPQDLARRDLRAANGKPAVTPRTERKAAPVPDKGKASRQHTEPVARPGRSAEVKPSAPAARSTVRQQNPAMPSQRQPKPVARYQAPQPTRPAGPADVARTPSVIPSPQPRAPKASPPPAAGKGDRAPSHDRGKSDRGKARN